MLYVDEDACLIVVDVQNDFCPGGALGVEEGDKVIPVLNKWIQEFGRRRLPVVFTQDWHPSNHSSFRQEGGIWPPHCVQNTWGAELHMDLIVGGEICRKGYHPEIEAYSGFDGAMGGEGGQPLDAWLKTQGVRRLYIGGLATDYCVKATVLDALGKGYEVMVIRDGVRAVNVNPKDGEIAISEMIYSGATII